MGAADSHGALFLRGWDSVLSCSGNDGLVCPWVFVVVCLCGSAFLRVPYGLGNLGNCERNFGNERKERAPWKRLNLLFKVSKRR